MVKILEGVGFRVQYSVFEAHLSAGQIKDLIPKLQKAMKKKEDSICMYRLCGECAGHVRRMGTGKPVEKPDVMVV